MNPSPALTRLPRVLFHLIPMKLPWNLLLHYHQSTDQESFVNMKNMMKICLCLVACASSLSASAKDNACQIQGEFTEDGIHEVINTCGSNKGASDQDFKTYCQELHNAYRADRNKTTANKITMKMGSSCPANHKGTCEGAFGKKWNLLFMGNDSLLKNGQSKLFCDSIEGKWKQ